MSLLTLTRGPGESIRIGREVRITVVEIRGNTVRIAVEAPSSTEIVRSELLASPPGRESRLKNT